MSRETNALRIRELTNTVGKDANSFNPFSFQKQKMQVESQNSQSFANDSKKRFYFSEREKRHGKPYENTDDVS